MHLQTLLRSMFKKIEPISLPRKELVRVISPSPPVRMKLYDLETRKQNSAPAKCPCCQRPYPIELNKIEQS